MGVIHAFIMREQLMCDYSLHHVASRPARVGDKLVTTRFGNSTSRGLAAVGDPKVAVCLLPGTELAFDRPVQYDRYFRLLPSRKTGEHLARFRQINEQDPHVHHDALELPSGEIVLLTRLREGQCATVLQLPLQTSSAAAANQGEKILSVEVL